MKRIRRLIYIVTRLWTLPVQRAIEKALFAKAQCQQLEGFCVCVNGADQAVVHSVERIRSALCILGAFDKRRLMLARRYFRKFIISRMESAIGGNFPRSEDCHLSLQFVLEYPAADLAIVIVHETTHARIDRAGIPFYPDLRKRIERRCTLEEIAFAERLPVETYSSIGVWVDGLRKTVRELSV